MLLGDQKFWIFSCVIAIVGIRNSEFFSVFLGGSEILNFCLCSWGDQKFWIFACVLGGIRNSEFLPECVLGGIRNSEFLPVLLGDQKFWIFSCVIGGIRNSEFFPVFLGGSEILNPLLCCWGCQRSWIPSCGLRGSFGFYAWLRHSNEVWVKNGRFAWMNFVIPCKQGNFPCQF